MSTDQPQGGAPFMQRLYDRIWLLALLAMLFFGLSYVAWGVTDVLAVG